MTVPVLRVATDVGGTFTDLAYCEVDRATGAAGPVRSVKVDTTPPDFPAGVMAAMRSAAIDPASCAFFAHGSTVVINAITERRGAKVALITTHGFRDVLEIARGNRPDLFNFRFLKPAPFVARYLRLELEERTGYQGTVQQPVNLGPLPGMVSFLQQEGVEAVAVCFLHAYANPANEARVLERLGELWPSVSRIASHQISREWREYERTSTTVLSAYVHPVTDRYIRSLQRRLGEGGHTGTLYLMQSSGGIIGAPAARRNPIALVESGPASGIRAAQRLGDDLGIANLLVLDIGGTTAKCALIAGGQIEVSTQYYVERDRRNPGYPIQTPVTELVEIGNGGGSIAWVDAGDKLHVGPRSAGADPGPAAYGRGGTQPTTTDANLVLGRIDPASFAGGRIAPDMDAVAAAFAPLQRRLGMSKVELARAVIRIANANMANALRLVSVNRGHDPRDFALVAFGGGGAMHALALAEALSVPRVIVPAHSDVFSAWGMLHTDLRADVVRTCPMAFDGTAVPLLRATLAEMRAEAAGTLVSENDCKLRFELLVDLRYDGQEHTVKTGLRLRPDGDPDVEATVSAFHEAHRRRYTYQLDNPVELVSLHVVAHRPMPRPARARRARSGRDLAATLLHRREVDFDERGVHLAAVHDGLLLEPGMALQGPLVIQEPSVSLVVPPGPALTVDEFGNYHVTLEPA